MSHQESTAPTAANIAAELRRIADALRAVHPDTRLFADLTLSDRSADKLDDAAKMGLVDALLMAIAGRPGKRGDKFNDGIHYGDQLIGTGPMSLSVYCMVADPAEVSELERLRAELAEAKAALAARDSRPQMAMETDERCPDPECGESLREIEAGRVGHCGRGCGHALVPRDNAYFADHPYLGEDGLAVIRKVLS